MKKVVVVTGGSRGIGKSLCDIFIEKGYTVVNASRNKPAEKSKAVFIKTDVSNKESCKQMIQRVVRKFGRIDILANNAGVLHPDTIKDFKDKTFRSNFEINVFGSFYCAHFAAKQMIKQKSGQIINISSSSGVSFKEGFISYLASKWAVVGLSGAARLELKKDGIDVICFCPGGTKTDLFRHFTENPSKDYMDPRELAEQIHKASERQDKEKWLFTYARKDRILRQYGFSDYPVPV